MVENLRVDHVIFGTVDMERTAAEILERHGLASVVGGRHEGRGTGNRIVPLGSAYLELMGVVDEAEAANHPFGRWFTEQISDRDRFLMWCIGTDDIDAVSTRLGLEVEEWTRATPDGAILSWRLAGLEISNEHPEIPFFIQWTVPEELHPSKARALHPNVPSGYAMITLAGDHARVQRWIGDSDLPVRFTTGKQGVVDVTIATDRGEIALP
ncbi:MAG: hypothetical protein QOG16_133 [Actinomycetota bacterium]|nr:hypothetical protein [Actinomycetota bacterium]